MGRNRRKTIRSYTEAQEVKGNSSKSPFVWIDVEAMVGWDRKDLFQMIKLLITIPAENEHVIKVNENEEKGAEKGFHMVLIKI